MSPRGNAFQQITGWIHADDVCAEESRMPEIRTSVREGVDAYLGAVVRQGIFSNKADLVRAALVHYVNATGSRVQARRRPMRLSGPCGRPSIGSRSAGAGGRSVSP